MVFSLINLLYKGHWSYGLKLIIKSKILYFIDKYFFQSSLSAPHFTVSL